MKIVKKNYPALLMIMTATVIWEGYVALSQIEKFILPPPSQIISAFFKQWTPIFEHTKVTIYEALVGYLVALIVSIFLAIAIDNNRFLKQGFYPILVASQTIPIIAIGPLITAWFGFGILPKVLVVALVAFFPIVVNMIDGFNSTDKDLINLLKTMNASKWQIFLKVKIPSALPNTFSGLRIAATYSVMGAVIGEWLGASKGLGIYIRNASNSYLIDQVFAAIIVIVGISILFYSVLLIVERLIIPWNREIEDEF